MRCFPSPSEGKEPRRKGLERGGPLKKKNLEGDWTNLVCHVQEKPVLVRGVTLVSSVSTCLWFAVASCYCRDYILVSFLFF